VLSHTKKVEEKRKIPKSLNTTTSLVDSLSKACSYLSSRRAPFHQPINLKWLPHSILELALQEEITIILKSLELEFKEDFLEPRLSRLREFRARIAICHSMREPEQETTKRISLRHKLSLWQSSLQRVTLVSQTWKPNPWLLAHQAPPKIFMRIIEPNFRPNT